MEQQLPKEELRASFAEMPLAHLKGIAKDLAGEEDGSGFEVALVLLWAFAHQTHDDKAIADATGIPIEHACRYTANLVRNGIWRDPEPDIDDGVIFGMMICAGLDQLRRLPNNNWLMTDKGKAFVEQEILSTEEGKALQAELIRKMPKQGIQRSSRAVASDRLFRG